MTHAQMMTKSDVHAYVRCSRGREKSPLLHSKGRSILHRVAGVRVSRPVSFLTYDYDYYCPWLAEPSFPNAAPQAAMLAHGSQERGLLHPVRGITLGALHPASCHSCRRL